MIDYRIDRWNGVKEFFKLYVSSGDCDPAYPMLKFYANKKGLNIEQRYWLAFLYSTCYQGITAGVMFEAFPDIKNTEGIEEWWESNKYRLHFETDRAKVKNFNLLPRIVNSYKELLGNRSQEQFWNSFVDGNEIASYQRVYKEAGKIYYFGRFSLFLFLEILNVLTDLKITPDTLNLSQSESARNGLCYVLKKDDWVTLHHFRAVGNIDYNFLNQGFKKLMYELKAEYPMLKPTVWNVETMLCAYKKLFWESRYLGYYIDRAMLEILKMEQLNNTKYDLMWEARRELFNHKWLGELNGWVGIRHERLKIFTSTGLFE